MITAMRPTSGRVLAGISAILWLSAIVVALIFEGVTGPAIVLGWLILLAMPLTVTALVVLRSERAQRRDR